MVQCIELNVTGIVLFALGMDAASHTLDECSARAYTMSGLLNECDTDSTSANNAGTGGLLGCVTDGEAGFQPLLLKARDRDLDTGKHVRDLLRVVVTRYSKESQRPRIKYHSASNTFYTVDKRVCTSVAETLTAAFR